MVPRDNLNTTASEFFIPSKSQPLAFFASSAPVSELHTHDRTHPRSDDKQLGITVRQENLRSVLCIQVKPFLSTILGWLERWKEAIACACVLPLAASKMSGDDTLTPWRTALSRLFTLTDAKLLGFSVEHSGIHPRPMHVFPRLTVSWHICTASTYLHTKCSRATDRRSEDGVHTSTLLMLYDTRCFRYDVYRVVFLFIQALFHSRAIIGPCPAPWPRAGLFGWLRSGDGDYGSV